MTEEDKNGIRVLLFQNLKCLERAMEVVSRRIEKGSDIDYDVIGNPVEELCAISEQIRLSARYTQDYL